MMAIQYPFCMANSFWVVLENFSQEKGPRSYNPPLATPESKEGFKSTPFFRIFVNKFMKMWSYEHTG